MTIIATIEATRSYFRASQLLNHFDSQTSANMSLKNKRCLITGGSAGLGAAVARKFASEGAHLTINYASSRDRADALVTELRKDYPDSKVSLLQGDVSQASICTDLVEKTVSTLGGIDIVISNAGWTKATDWEDLESFSEEEWDRTYAMNVKAHLFLFKAAKKHFNSNADGGNMIITTSVAGIKASGSALAYSVSKHGAIALARGLALHQGPKCRINTVAPGLIETDWSTQQFGQERIDYIKSITPLEKNATLSDCADVFAMLAVNSSITGQTIVMDGGFSLK